MNGNGRDLGFWRLELWRSKIVALWPIWRKQPTAPELLEVTIQRFHVARNFPPVRWVGRRRGQQFQWESATPMGARIRVEETWEVSDLNRAQFQAQLLGTLRDSGFGQYASDQIGWYGCQNSSSERRFRARDFQIDSLLEVLERVEITFSLYLFQGLGNDFVEATGRDLPGWQQQLRTWQWSAQARLLAYQERLQQGLWWRSVMKF